MGVPDFLGCQISCDTGSTVSSMCHMTIGTNSMLSKSVGNAGRRPEHFYHLHNMCYTYGKCTALDALIIVYFLAVAVYNQST